MEMAIWRGIVEDLTTPDSGGAVECRLAQGKIKLHSDLTSNVGRGDKVLVAGNIADGVLHAMAVHNLTRNRLTHIDPSNQVLLAGLWGFIGMMSAAFGWPMLGHLSALSVVLNVLAIVGIVGVIRSALHIIRVTLAANWIRYPDLAERS
ncbi:MAG: hypothetical protein IPK65_07535 [Gammaproteobacteria bacterium]|nr:hypothetical protein [Gammaproteobacteria bacterium]